MKDYSEKFLVVGAGPVGLATAKAFKDAGIAYHQIDADTDVGGNWKHGVYRSAHIISSKHTTEYADYPMPEDYPDFPSRKQMLDYLNSYADAFCLRENIEFGTKVVMINPRPDEFYEAEFADGEKRVYKGVAVCSGHHWQKRFPAYEGEFAGEYFHSKDYKSPEQLADKRVLVIGGGNSACDVASEAARVGRSCDLSLRRGYWFLPKTLFGKPTAESFLRYFPVAIQRFFIKSALRVVLGKYEDYGLPKPDHKIFEKHPTLNSELLHYLKHGRIKPRPDVKKFEGKTVHFVDGTSDEFDTVVCGTGFYVSFPFLPEGVVEIKNGNLAMVYAGCVLEKHKNLYILGTTQPRYGFGPLVTPSSEMLAQIVKLQNEMELPIGLVMKHSGAKLPDSHLVDPISALRQMKIAKYTLPLLLKKEKKLRRKYAGQVNSKENAMLQPNSDMQVY
ncbi:MAG: NAD(P)-binding domain-containing protein [Acidobacteriota bacterium]|nr:NAD(P)-binding domain-containing protein [Acidobacteriota bacterium]